MPSSTTSRVLLGFFLQGAESPVTNQHATTPPVRFPASLSLRAILVGRNGARGRGARGMVSGCKGLREEGGKSAGEGGRNGEAVGRPCGEAHTMMMSTLTARGKTMAEMECGRRGQEYQVHSDRDKGERCKTCGLWESNVTSKGWSGRSTDDLAGSEKEVDGMTAGGMEEIRTPLTASPWGTQESGAGAVQGDARAGRSNTGKSPSLAANEEGVQGHHGAGEARARRKKRRLAGKTGGKTLGVRGDDGGCKASGVAQESPGVGG